MKINRESLNFTEKGLDSLIKKMTHPFILADRGGPKSYTGLTLQFLGKSESYIVNKKINGKTYTRKVGNYSDISPSIARKRAKVLVEKLEDGDDPNVNNKIELAKERILKLTIQMAFDDFLLNSKALAESTIKGYKRAIKLTFGKVKHKPLFSVSAELISKLHFERSKTTKSKADHDMRVFRLLWNWSVNKYKQEFPEILNISNPVSEALNSGHRAGTKGWNKVPRKQTIIPRKKLPAWFSELRNQLIKPSKSKTREATIYLTEFLILTGLRFKEASTLTWDKVNLNKETMIIDDKTGKNRQELIKPITHRIREIIKHQVDKNNTYIFPGLTDYIRDTRNFRAKIFETTGIEFTNHDLRRVYLSAGSRASISSEILKRLVNHLPRSQDVTQGYIIQSMDELQEYAQRIEDQILIDAKLKDESTDNTLNSLLAHLSEEEKKKVISQLTKG